MYDENESVLTDRTPVPEPENADAKHEEDDREKDDQTSLDRYLSGFFSDKDDDEDEPSEDREEEKKDPEEGAGEKEAKEEDKAPAEKKTRKVRDEKGLDLDRADDGLPVALSHDGSLHENELLKSREEREEEAAEEEEEELFEDTGFDEDAEKEKKEKFLLKDRERRRREREAARNREEYYRRQALSEEGQAKGIEEEQKKGGPYDEMIRDRYSWENQVHSSPEEMPEETDIYADVETNPDVVEEEDPSFFTHVQRRIPARRKNRSRSGSPYEIGGPDTRDTASFAENGNAAGYDLPSGRDTYNEAIRAKYGAYPGRDRDQAAGILPSRDAAEASAQAEEAVSRESGAETVSVGRRPRSRKRNLITGPKKNAFDAQAGISRKDGASAGSGSSPYGRAGTPYGASRGGSSGIKISGVRLGPPVKDLTAGAAGTGFRNTLARNIAGDLLEQESRREEDREKDNDAKAVLRFYGRKSGKKASPNTVNRIRQVTEKGVISPGMTAAGIVLGRGAYGGGPGGQTETDPGVTAAGSSPAGIVAKKVNGPHILTRAGVMRGMAEAFRKDGAPHGKKEDVTETTAYRIENYRRSKMIHIGRDGSQQEEESVLSGQKKRIGTKSEALASKISTTDMRGAGKLAVGGKGIAAPAAQGALAAQSAAARAGSARIWKFHMAHGAAPWKNTGERSGNGYNAAEEAGTGFFSKSLRKAVLAVAKRAVAGITATAIGFGAAVGAGSYRSWNSGTSVNAYYYPVQAHLPASEMSETSMTQEVLNGMTARLKAYGIPVNMSSSGMGNGTIRIHVPGYNVSGSGYNQGDCQIITDGNGSCLIIDGGCGSLSDMMIDYLKAQNITSADILVSHWHEDHSYGFIKLLQEVSDGNMSFHINKLYCIPPAESTGWDYTSHAARLVEGVSRQGGQVIYITPDRVSTLSVGGIRMNVWRMSDPPSRDPTTKVNDMSIQVYFPDLYYLTTGDISFQLGSFLDKISGATIKMFKVPHHGNGSRTSMGRLKDEFKAEICWDNTVNGISFFEIATLTARIVGLKTIETKGDLDFVAENGTMSVTGDGMHLSYPIPYSGGGSSTRLSGPLMQQVCAYAKQWVGKIPYKSSVTGNDPNNERSMDLAEGRGSDCSWFVYHVLKHFDLVGDEFIHSYEWGNDPSKYPNFSNVGTDMSTAIPGDVLCTGKGISGSNSHVAIYVGDGKQVECAAGYGTILSDAPSSVRQIVRYNGASVTSTMGGSPSYDQQGSLGFTPETEQIVEAHMNDFNYSNYDSFMASRGGVESYIRSLGGVFSKWVGRQANVRTSADFQEIAEYIMGLYCIWGIDYKGGGPATSFNEEGKFRGKEYGRFYAGFSPGGNGPVGGIVSRDLEKVLEDKDQLSIDCGSGIAQIMRKAGLFMGYAGQDCVSDAQREIDRYGGASVGGKIIYNASELQVGDMVQFFSSECDAAFTNQKGWHHATVVGEIWNDGTIILYDTGHAFPENMCWKYKFTVNSDGSPSGMYGDRNYTRWFGMRMRSIAQTGGLSGFVSSAATMNLGDIEINSVKVDGSPVSKDDIDMKNLGSYTRNGVRTTNVKVNYRFVDRNGNVLGDSAGGFGGNATFTLPGAASGDAAKILQIAESHMGSPYVYGGNSWENGIDCSHFVTRVLQEAGVYSGGYMTSYGWASYGKEVPDISHAQAGDIVISNSGGHVSIYDGVKWVYEAKGSQYGCVHDRLPGNITTIRRILPDAGTAGTSVQTSSSSGAGVDNTPSGQGQTVEIPDGLGTEYSYMGWQCIKSVSSNQYKLREQAGMNFDSEGFGVINGRYVVACTQTFGNVGDYIDFYNTNGMIFHCVIGDIKSPKDAGYSKWGHKNGRNVIEFVVDMDTWYSNGYGSHANPGTSSCHPEWSGSISKAMNLGSYFDDPNGVNLLSGGGILPDGNPIDRAAMYLMKQVLSMSALGSYYDDPAEMEKYGKYCYDIIDYAVCRSHGADVEYTTVDGYGGSDSYMTCTTTIIIICSLRLFEEHDENYTSWDTAHEDGDLMPTHYMSLEKEPFETIFNVDTTIRNSSLAGDPGFEGVERVVYEFFKGKGYGPAQIAGIMANIKRESGFRPEAMNPSGASGLFQWMGGRLNALKDLASSKGKDWKDVNAQLDYAYEEIHGGKGWGGYSSQKDEFESTSDPYQAGVLFSRYFERHGIDSENSARGKLAREYYNRIVSAATGGASSINYVQWAINIANDDSHGYSQGSRTGNPDYDCSSFVFYALKNAGYDVGGSPFTTYSMDGPLKRCGFQKIPISSENDLRPGDILWRSTHTEIYIGNGKRVGAHSSYGHPGAGDQSGDEISVKDYSGGWDWVYRKM